MIKVYEHKGDMSIWTDDSSESDFLRLTTSAIWDMMEQKKFDEPNHITTLVKNIVEVCCALRGYKSTVDKKVVIYSGMQYLDESDVVFTEGDDTNWKTKEED